ncbi:hypothetical protein E1176_02550 [Fulvivirga sp. RKSG066]|nr:hypothetical protein [Fulvivirga aurantia]
MEKHKIKVKSFYKDIFNQLKTNDIKTLVLDLRDNTGGRNEFAEDMVPFILKSENDTPYLKKTISWEGKEKIYDMPKASKDVFSGKIFVLVNGRTYSAGSMLTRYLREFAQATVIGEETGTRYEGFAAGSKQFVTLSNSQLRIGIPRYHITFPPSEKQTTSNRGLIPDYTVEYKIEDLIKERDLHLEKVHELIDSNAP